MWELDYKGSWAPEDWCFWIVVLKKTPECPLDCKEIQPVHPKENQSWICIGRTDVEAETPILWPPDTKNWLLGKDPDAGKDRKQEEKRTIEDEMVLWHSCTFHFELYLSLHLFSSSHVWMSELDYKGSWAPKNWCSWTVVLEKTLESPLDCREIQPVHPKGDQSWVFIGRTNVEAETPILWPPDVKSWLIGKDPDAGKDWRQEEKGMTEGEMAGWHHQLNGHEFG